MSKQGKSTTLAVLSCVSLLVLGCSGLMGYGTELGSTTIQPPGVFSLTVQTVSDEPHNLWLDYDVSFTGGDYQVTGTIDASSGGTNLASWPVNLNSAGAPIGGGRLTLNASDSNIMGKGSARATIFLVDLPKQVQGTSIDLNGSFTPMAGTTIHSLRLVVTD
jgi:hypothetical protein